MPRIPLNAHAQCADGPCGDLCGLVVRADTRVLEYYVVRDTTPGHPIERLVPRSRIDARGNGAEAVHVECTLGELEKMRALNVQELQSDAPHGANSPTAYGRAGGLNLVDAERAPDGTGVLRSTQQVEATNGKIGKLSGVVVDDQARITHFYTRLDRGGDSELFLPVSAVSYVDRWTVYLRLDKRQIDSLPPLPAQVDKHGAPIHKHMELVARIYDTPGGAAEALESLRNSQEHTEHPINIREVAVLIRDGDAPPHVDRRAQSKVGKGAAVGAAAGGLLAALGPVGLLVGVAAGGAVGGFAGAHLELGLPDTLLNSMQAALKPDHSALIVLFEHHPDQDSQEVRALLDGAISHASMVDSLVQELLVAEPEQATAPTRS